MFKFFGAVFSRAPDEQQEAPTIPNAPAPIVPEADDQETTVVATLPREGPEPVIDSIDLEPIFCMIDYSDAAGNGSRRRITTRRISRGPHAPLLTAVCHERRAIRHFRCDRIVDFITHDGEVISTQKFLRTVLLVDIEAFASQQRGADDLLITARAIRDKLRPQLAILVAAARSNDEFHRNEVDAVVDYLEEEVCRLEPRLLSGHAPIDVINTIAPMIVSMRPSREALPGYLERMIERMSVEDFTRFEDALRAVVEADGYVGVSQDLFLSDFNAMRRLIEKRER
jgi:hypothetical protein